MSRGDTVTIEREELESMESTLKILSSRRAMEKIRKGEKQLSEGRGSSLEEVRERLEG